MKHRGSGRLLAGVAVGLTVAAALSNVATAAENRADLMKAHRGGTARLVAKAAAGTLDPQVNYTQHYWELYQSVYDGLVAFRKGGGADSLAVVPDLAETLPAPQNGGKTYVFKLRQGISFSNGKALTTDDVVASFQRIFKVSSPTSGTFYNGIVGADACLAKPESCTLEGGVVADKANGTVTINLVAPDAEFFYKIAVPHASILPSETPTKDIGTDPVPGTGAYAFGSYDPNTRLTLVRNPHFKEWSVEAQPDGYIDGLNIDFGLTEEAQINAIINGQADTMAEPPPTDRLPELGTKYASQIHLSPQNATWYAPLNTNLAPFDNLKARQALAYAVNLKSVVNFFGGSNLAAPTCQILPPGFPGYEPFCLYTGKPGPKWSGPDMDKAKQLVEESGTKGQAVAIVVEDSDLSRNIGLYLQSVLKQLGYDASVKSISSNIHWGYIENTNNKVQISVTQWYADYPAPANFLNVLLGCGSFRPGSDSSPNISGFCDKALQAKMDQAMALAVTDPAAANKLWAEVDKGMMEQAPLIPLFTPKHVDFMSKRVGNFLYSSASSYQWVWALAWVR